MAKDRGDVEEGKIVETKKSKILNIPSLTKADNVHSYQVIRDVIYYSVADFEMDQLSSANARMAAISAFATFFLGTAITLWVGAESVDIPGKLYLPTVLGASSLFSVALAVGLGVYAAVTKFEINRIADKIRQNVVAPTAAKPG